MSVIVIFEHLTDELLCCAADPDSLEPVLRVAASHDWDTIDPADWRVDEIEQVDTHTVTIKLVWADVSKTFRCVNTMVYSL